MTVFSTTQQLYDSVGMLFERLQSEDAGAADAVRKAKLVIRLAVQEPAGFININGRHNPVQTSFGNNGLRPDLDITLDGDTLHEIMLGNLSLTKAIGQKRLIVKGPIFKTMALADVFYRGQRIYPQVLQAQGLG